MREKDVSFEGIIRHKTSGRPQKRILNGIHKSFDRGEDILKMNERHLIFFLFIWLFWGIFCHIEKSAAAAEEHQRPPQKNISSGPSCSINMSSRAAWITPDSNLRKKSWTSI